ncbi:MAG: GLPGLI family protein [Candidatus Pseudobacter hemicellulosilyticus]|uniref:GLPGLI family protein n=1 Tax=Candidatus Pseudobacter hemicellulosilyticus TaxID=3121375 RepID=A0AAJ5WYS0_9BACT|nr:MAG: GLPGLI family protein [Pseudobacter sp.]
MKRTISALIFLLLAVAGKSQLKTGKVIYQQTIRGGKTTVNMNGETRSFDRPDMVMKMELLFSNDQSLKIPIQEERPEAETFNSGGGPGGPGGGPMGMRMAGMAFGGNATVYHNFTEGRKVEEREAMGKTYLITDSIRGAGWKLTGQTKTILNYPCQEARLQTIVMTRRMTFSNGEMKPEEKPDTLQVVAWFAPSIPVPAGPDYQGQLPGLILELDIQEGKSICTALSVEPNAPVSNLKEPKKGKKITAEAFKKEQEEGMQKMMQRGGGMRPPGRM